MRRHAPIVVAVIMVLGGIAVPAAADHKTRPHSQNVHAQGSSLHPATFFGEPDGVRHISSDVAFRGSYAFQGNYDGFRIIDISAPGNPKEVNWTHCNGDQGDIVVYEDILVRSWNSKKTSARDCDGTVVPVGWEGVHVFDISDLNDPMVVAAVELPCGSHTASLAGVSGGNVIVYSNNSSGAGCTGGTANGDFMDVLSIPLATPAAASLIHREPLEGPIKGADFGCHDAGVILGNENKAVCASADFANVFDIGDNATPGGSLEDPEFLFGIDEPGVGGTGTNGRWHSGAFTWDGEVLILGWEPGGGASPECESGDPDVDKSAFFYDADTGAKLGQWTLPRPQDGAGENCTIHNFNVVPFKEQKGARYILVLGNYQAGTWVVNFSNPAAATTVGYSDPPPISPADLGGAWSTYWYNGRLYESNITEGLHVFNVSGSEMSADMKLDALNPQTQLFTIG